MRALVMVALLAGCAKTDWRASAPAPPRLPSLMAKVTLKLPGRAITVEGPLRVTEEERRVGLMHRKERLSDREGMLFAMDGDADQSFWMKNTFIPLDMVFIDKDGVVVGVLEDVEPLTETSRRIGKPSRFVLELDAGFCARHGLGPGANVEMHLSEEKSPNS